MMICWYAGDFHGMKNNRGTPSYVQIPTDLSSSDLPGRYAYMLQLHRDVTGTSCFHPTENMCQELA